MQKSPSLFVVKCILSYLLCLLGGVIISLSLVSCVLLGIDKTYALSVKIIDEENLLVAGAIVKSTNQQSEISDESGLVHLRYRHKGLHVVTVIAKGKNTKQIKVQIPIDKQEFITIQLESLE